MSASKTVKEQRYATINMEVERALDLHQLAALLHRLELLGLSKTRARSYYRSAASVAALLKSENNSIHGKPDQAD